MTDISVEGVMERGVLPPNLTDNAKVVLPAGRYPVQVLIFFIFLALVVLWIGMVLMLIRIWVRPTLHINADLDPDSYPTLRFTRVGKSALRVCRSKSGAVKMIRIHNTDS